MSKRGAVASTLALVVTMLVTVTLPGAAAQQRPQFGTTVEVVQLQVEVEDDDGNHVSGLTTDDFALRVDGDDRGLVGVYEVDLGRDDVTAEGPLPPAGWRQFLLFFDFTFADRRGIFRSRDGALEFVQNQLHPLDLVGVATYTRTGGVRLITPFTADHAQVAEALRGFGLDRGSHIVDPVGFAVEPFVDLIDADAGSGGGGGPAAEEVEALLEEAILNVQRSDLQRYREEVVRYADQLGVLGDMLQATRGRKHVLLFSAGFTDEVLSGQSLQDLAAESEAMAASGQTMPSSERFGSSELRSQLDDALEQLRISDTVFHVVDAGGLGASSNRQGLSLLADGTDGTITWNRNDLAPALAELAEDTSRYYVLAYRKDQGDPDTVELEIDVRREDARIAAAPRRYAPPPAYAEMDEAQRQLQLAEYISKGIEEEDVPLALRAVPFAGDGEIQRLAVVVEVPFDQLRAIADERGDGKAELDILGYSLDESNRMRDLFTRRLNLDVERLASGPGEVPFRYYDLLWATAGKHRVRILVRDTQVGRLSTRTEPVDVPAFEGSGLTTSGAVAVDLEHPGLVMRGLDPASPPEHRRGGPVAYPFTVGEHEVTPAAMATAAPGGKVQCHLVVYNLSRHPFTGQTQMGISARLVDGLGNARELSDVSVIGRHQDTATAATSLVAEITVPAGVEPAIYRLEVTVVDGINGQNVVQSMPVTVLAGSEVTAH